MSPRTRAALYIVGVLVVALIGYFFLVRPKTTELSEVQAQVEQAQQEEQNLRAELARREALRDNAQQLQAELDRLQELVPSRDEVANFIFLVQEAANASGVGFVQITPELPKPPPEGAQVAEVRTTIGALGGYFAVQDFFRRLYDLDRAVRVDNLTMVGEEDETTSETLIDLDMTARVFFELPAGAGGTATA